jgi:hypothetical protein
MLNGLVQTKIEDLLSRRNEVLEVDGTLQMQGGLVDNEADYEMRISDAHRKMDVMRTKFEKLRTVCISSEQGLKGVLDRVKVALREMEPSELAPTSKIPQGTPPRQSKKLDRRERCASFPVLSTSPVCCQVIASDHGHNTQYPRVVSFSYRECILMAAHPGCKDTKPM